MIDTSKFGEHFLQHQRFKRALPYLKGDVLDFGGNEGELRQFVKGDYTLVNYDHSPMEGKLFDTIVLLAVVEHIDFDEVFKIFSKLKKHLRPNGKIILTTPTPASKPILEFLSHIGVVGRENILEHKHYWRKSEIYNLATSNGFSVCAHKLFQVGFNRFAVFEHKQ